MDIARHDVYFTIGETVGQPGALFPDCGLQWEYTPPPVFLPAWAPTRTDSKAPYTTVTNWWGALMEFQGQSYYNGKRDGFLPFRDLPLRTTVPLELAIGGAAEDNDCETLRARGWRVCDAFAVASTPTFVGTPYICTTCQNYKNLTILQNIKISKKICI